MALSVQCLGIPLSGPSARGSHVSLLKMNIAAVERHFHGGRKTASAGVEARDVAVVSLERGWPWSRESSVLS